MEHISPGTIVSSGVDYLTVTFKPDHPNISQVAQLVATEHALAQRAGETLKHIDPLGYRGVASDHIFFGGREDGYKLRVSSAPADRFTKEVMALESGYKVTRIDLQVSAKRLPDSERFSIGLRNAVREAEKAARRKRPVEVHVYEAGNGGDGLTVFPRVSECHFRIYDKSAEQRQLIEPDITRWEGEFKGKTAMAVWATVMELRDTKRVARAIVCDRLRRVGIVDDWMRQAEEISIPTVYKKTDDERRLSWLANHVKGTVDRLKEAGLEDDVRKALGLE